MENASEFANQISGIREPSLTSVSPCRASLRGQPGPDRLAACGATQPLDYFRSTSGLARFVGRPVEYAFTLSKAAAK